MRIAVLLGTAMAALAMNGYAIEASPAIQLSDGTVYFAQPPQLVEAATTYNNVYFWGAKYYFAVSLPENAGEPLQKITINQREGLDYIRFDLKNSFAVVGERSRHGQRVEFQEATSDRQTQTVSLTFDPPLSPGQIITITLKPVQNPTVEGVYLFGVTAFPPGEKAHGQFVGFGRLHFYRRGAGSWGFPGK